MFSRPKGTFTPRKPIVSPTGVMRMTSYEIKVAAEMDLAGNEVNPTYRAHEVYSQHGYEELCKAPALKPDGHGGYFIIVDNETVCPACGNFSYDDRMLIAFNDTKHPDYTPGQVVKQILKGCRVCYRHRMDV